MPDTSDTKAGLTASHLPGLTAYAGRKEFTVWRRPGKPLLELMVDENFAHCYNKNYRFIISEKKIDDAAKCIIQLIGKKAATPPQTSYLTLCKNCMHQTLAYIVTKTTLLPALHFNSEVRFHFIYYIT
jgi:hypothetical protein